MKIKSCFSLCMFLAVIFSSSVFAKSTSQAVPGGVVEISLYSKTPPKAFIQNKPLLVTHPAPHEWKVLVGIPLDQTEPMQVTLNNVNGVSKKQTIFIKPKAYPVQRIHIKDKKKVTPPKEDLIRIEKEDTLLRKAFKTWRPVEIKEFKLHYPLKAPISSAFGLKRVVNGIPKSPHKGVDFAAPQGAAIKPVAAGIVTLIGDFFYTGNTVVVDHGQGWHSIYCHLEKVSVRANQEVSLRTVIGLVGKTGRATGPHLHFGLNLNEERVDPELFWNLES